MSIYDKASLVQIPSGYKAGTLYNVVPNTADKDFEFERGSTGTRVNKDGLIETVAIGVPRLNYPLLDGVVQDCPTLLLEPSRRNDILYSEDIESWSIYGTITKENNVAISPDGTLNAGTITTNDASGFHRITQTISVSSNSTYTSSLFIKKVQSQTNYMGIGFIFTGGTTDVGYVIFDAVNGIAVSADVRIDVISEVKDFGDYWRLQSTATDNGSNTSLQFNIYATLSTNGTTTGLGISSPRTIWGAQLEVGSYPTSYIPTNGEVGGVTRSADDCVDAGTAADFNDSEGVLYVNAKIDDPSEADDNDFSLGDGSFVSNSVEISFKNISASSQSIVGKCAIDGSSISLTGTTITDTSIKHDLFHKVAYQYKQADFKMFVNGFKIGTSTYNDIFPSGGLVRVSFEGNGTAGTKFRGNTKEVMTFNEALSDSELEALTSYSSFNEMATEQLYTIE
jgi:hypothetical protein